MERSDDKYNDETFGSACAIAAGLPSFFQNTTGTTVLDALGNIRSLECGQDDDDLENLDNYEFSRAMEDDVFDSLHSPDAHLQQQVSVHNGAFHSESTISIDEWKPSSLLSDSSSRLPSYISTPCQSSPSASASDSMLLPPGARVLQPSEIPIMSLSEMEKILTRDSQMNSKSATPVESIVSTSAPVPQESLQSSHPSVRAPVIETPLWTNRFPACFPPVPITAPPPRNPPLPPGPPPRPIQPSGSNIHNFPFGTNVQTHQPPASPISQSVYARGVDVSHPTTSPVHPPGMAIPQPHNSPRPGFNQSYEYRSPSHEGGRGRGSTGGMGGRGYPRGPSIYLPRLPCGEIMTASDVRFVVERVLAPTQPVDPYREEYYLLQLRWKRFEQMSSRLQREGHPPPPPLPLPLPTWPEMRERMRREAEQNRQDSRDRTRHWEEAEKVLGHVAKCDIARPRAQLALPDRPLLDADTEGSAKPPFCNRLWTARDCVQKGYSAFYNIQELLLLRTRDMVGSVEEREKMAALSSAVAVLGSCLGLPVDGGAGVDEVQVSLLLLHAKGKRLLVRSLWFLSVEHRWQLIPAFVTRTVTQEPAAASSDEAVAEDRLLTAISQFFEAQGTNASTTPQSEQTSTSVTTGLTQCLRGACTVVKDKTTMTKFISSCTSRAALLSTIVNVGNRVVESVDAQATASKEWVDAKELFVSMMSM